MISYDDLRSPPSWLPIQFNRRAAEWCLLVNRRPKLSEFRSRQTVDYRIAPASGQDQPRVSNPEAIAGLKPVTAEELGWRERFLAGELDRVQRDSSFAAGDDQPVAVGFEDFTRRALAGDDLGPVDDQAERISRDRGPSLPGGVCHRPGLHRADQVMDGLGRPRPVNQAVFLAKLGGSGYLRFVLGQHRDRPRSQLPPRLVPPAVPPKVPAAPPALRPFRRARFSFS